MTKIAASILTADFSNLQNEIKKVSGCDLLHLDVMDGKFVRNITFGPVVIKSILPFVRSLIDIHLMIEKPEKNIDDFLALKPHLVTFHYEATKEHIPLIRKIKEEKVKCGISINPPTDPTKIYRYLPLIDVILVMSVYPGAGGQKFIKNSIIKIKKLKKYISEKKLNTEIEVDGGVNPQNIPLLVKAGVDILVIGSYLFNSKNPELEIKKIKDILREKCSFRRARYFF